MSLANLPKYDLASVALLNRPDVQVLEADRERALLVELDRCKRLLLQLSPAGVESMPDGQPEREIQDFVRDLLHQEGIKDEVEQRLTRLANRYHEIRSKLAMANLRLVAHVAKKYGNRGISSSDLLQEGFCGLLRAIDRFEPDKQTRLASYAVWWIRQAVQRAVAAGAYPVRLNPRHLQQLAQSNADLAPAGKPGRKRRSAQTSTTIEQIHSATRPTLSLNANRRDDDGSGLASALAYPAREEAAVGA